MVDFIKDMLQHVVDLDPALVTDLGFQVEASPRIPGAFLVVVNDPPPTALQWIAAAIMTCILCTVGLVEYRRRQDPGPIARRPLVVIVWIAGLTASCLHNVDNLLRPGMYNTPTWVVAPKFAFPMDQGFIFWLAVLGIGLVALHRPHPVPIILHSVGTSFGALHYLVQSIGQFSAFAHFSIIGEVIMGLLVGIQMLRNMSPPEETVSRPDEYASVPREEQVMPTEEVPPGSSSISRSYMEMTTKSGGRLRQRSKSPIVK